VNRSSGGSDGDDGNVKDSVSKIIKDVRPNDKNKELRFADPGNAGILLGEA